MIGRRRFFQLLGSLPALAALPSMAKETPTPPPSEVVADEVVLDQAQQLPARSTTAVRGGGFSVTVAGQKLTCYSAVLESLHDPKLLCAETVPMFYAEDRLEHFQLSIESEYDEVLDYAMRNGEPVEVVYVADEHISFRGPALLQSMAVEVGYQYGGLRARAVLLFTDVVVELA